MEIEKMCECGCLENKHYLNNDPEGPCMICRCRAFGEKLTEEELMMEKMETESDEIIKENI